MESNNIESLGYYYVQNPNETISALFFTEKNEYIIAATSRGMRIYLSKNFGCIHFMGKYHQKKNKLF